MDNNKKPPKKGKKSSNYDPPFVVMPELQHKQTIIILHGRYNNGQNFGQGMLNCDIPGVGTLQQAFPHAKFIYPSAFPRPGILFGNSKLIQWFDNWFLDDPPEREEVQIEGLYETSEYVHQLLEEEIKAVGASNVALGGLSQGCAVTLISLLTWHGEPLGAAIGMSGWLPFSVPMMDIIKAAAKRREPTHGESNGREQAINYLHQVLDKTNTSPPDMDFQQTPFFLGHGEQDDKVYFHLGQRATTCLKELGACASFFGYSNLHHWYSKEMLADMVNFIKTNASW